MVEKPIYENQDWIVYADRMEFSDGSYLIDHGISARREGTSCWDWPLQLAEKNWFDVDTFAPAFLELLRATDTAVDADLLMTFHRIGKDAVKEKLFEQAAIDLKATGPGGALDFRRMVDVDAEVQRRLGN